MKLRMLSGLLVLIVLFIATWLASGLTASSGGAPRAMSRVQPAPIANPGSTWTVENRCRTLYLPAILRGGAGAVASAGFAPAQPAQSARLNCIQISDADLAQIEWDAVAETYARQANRNRRAFDMVPLSSWGH
jgi:hypothetical protein